MYSSYLTWKGSNNNNSAAVNKTETDNITFSYKLRVQSKYHSEHKTVPGQVR